VGFPVYLSLPCIPHPPPNIPTGIITANIKYYPAILAIAASSGWTTVPELDGLCETTGGSVILLKIPSDSPIYWRFLPQNFLIWTYKMRDGFYGGIYGFSVTEDGMMKIGHQEQKIRTPNRRVSTGSAACLSQNKVAP
jgi:sarcosine oxidase/L-pipecolate oxidase